jgi:Recombinase
MTLCYGYRVVKKLDERGDLIRGDREIDEAQAVVAHRIFRDFASGISPRAIARALNAEGIVGPDGSLWTRQSDSRSLDERFPELRALAFGTNDGKILKDFDPVFFVHLVARCYN